MRLVSALALVLAVAALGCDATPPTDPADQGPSPNPKDPWEPGRHGRTYDACAINDRQPNQSIWHRSVTFDADGNNTGEQAGWAGQPIAYTKGRRYTDGHLVELREAQPDSAPFVINTYIRNANGVVIRDEIDGDFVLAAVTDGHPDRVRYWRYDDRDLMVGFDYDDDGDGVIDVDHTLAVTYTEAEDLATIDERVRGGGHFNRYTYDAQHRLERIDEDDGNDGSVETVVNFTYDQYGRMQDVITNGVRETYEYAGFDRPVHLVSTSDEYWWDYSCGAARAAAPASDAVDAALVDAIARRR
ncbi:MAG: hypothetical protein K8W52_17680 [Deltaproteobacteria bacterium]|nr:hypothetical protein [Deltaproteobacteria bacterium]